MSHQVSETFLGAPPARSISEAASVGKEVKLGAMDLSLMEKGKSLVTKGFNWCH